MLIYAFVFGFVLDVGEPYFALFIFIGLTAWDFWNRGITNSIGNIKANKAIISKVYIPKYILLVEKMTVHALKMLISFGIIAAMMLYFRVEISLRILYLPLILLDLFLFTFAIGVHLLHFGVYVTDLKNIVHILMRFLFYLSGTFWSLETRLPGAWSEWALRCNPVAAIIVAMRDVLIYNETPPVGLLLGILVGSTLVAAWGIRRIYQHENSYAKVV